MKTAEKQKKKLKVPKPVIVALPPVAAILLCLVVIRDKGLADMAVRWFSRPAKDFLGTVCGLLPFSVMELLYIAAGGFVIYWIVSSVVKTVRDGHPLATALRRVFVLAMVVLYFLGAYLWLLGVDYYSPTFAETSGMTVAAISKDELKAVTACFVKNAAALSDTVQRDADGHFAEDLDGYFDRSVHVYDELIKEFPELSCRSRRPKKMLLFSKISSRMGFTGVFFPFTGESNINIDAPGCMMPCTIAHELAHQRSIHAEEEANFLGVAACLSSGDPVFVYSGCLLGSLYLMNALYSVDKDAWRELRACFSPTMETDWNDNNAYWAKFESKVTKVSEKAYDSFLKAQGQELGMRSYGACVDLLVAYYLPKIQEP